MMCMVTDRRRLCPAAGSFADARRRLAEQARWAVRNRIDLIQVRERDLEAAALADLVGDLLRVTRGSGTRVVVNDRLDVALACGADGVHLRHDSMTAEAVRGVVPDRFLVGRSVHSRVEAEGAGPVDYLIAGTVFPTASKPATASLIGLDGLADIVDVASAPVLGIGGIGRDQLDEVATTGAAGAAGVALFIEWFDRGETAS
jgi:thiamine-phosphate pyrophosphorylase